MRARRLELGLALKQVARRVADHCKRQGRTWPDGRPMRPSTQKISAWEHGVTRPSPRYHEAYAHALEWTPEELADHWPEASPAVDLPALDQGPGTEENGAIRPAIGYPSEWWPDLTLREDALVVVARQLLVGGHELEVSDPVKRRVLLTNAGGVAVGVALDPVLALVAAGRERITRTDVSDEWLADLQRTVRHYTRAFPSQRPNAAGYAQAYARMVFGDWANVNRLLGAPMLTRQRRELHRLYGQLAGVLGMALFDLGQERRAVALFQAGRDGAREAGDIDLQGWLFAAESLVPLWSGDPVATLELAGSGLAAVGHDATPSVARLQSTALAAQARLVAQGHAGVTAPEVEAGITTAHAVLGKASGGAWDGGRDVAEPFSYHEADLLNRAGRAYLDVGDAKRGLDACAQAARLRARTAVKSYTNVALNQLNLAYGALALGDPSAAAEQATVAIVAYTGHNQNVFRRAGEVRVALAPHRELAAVAEFSAVLRERAGERRPAGAAP